MFEQSVDPPIMCVLDVRAERDPPIFCSLMFERSVDPPIMRALDV